MKRRTYNVIVLISLVIISISIFDYGKIALGGEKYKGTITVPMIQCLTGAAGSIGTLYFKGFDALRRYTNEQRGGINGWKVEYKWADDGSNVPRAITIYKRFREEKPFVCVLPNSIGGEGLKPHLAADKTPGWNVYPSGGQIFPRTNIYVFGIPYEEQTAAFVDYVVKERKPQRPKIALIAHEIGWGKAMVEALQHMAPLKGADFVDHEFVGFSVVDTSTVLKRFEAKGVTDVYLGIYSASSGVPVSNWHDLGLKNKMTMTIIGADPPDLTVVLAKEKSEGVRFWSQFRFPSEAKTDPNVKNVTEFWDTIHPEPINDASFGGWMAMEVLYEAIRLSLQMVNNDATQLNGDIMTKGFEAVKDFEGTLHPKVTLGPGVNNTFSGIRMAQIQKDPSTGKIEGVPKSDWVTVKLLPRQPGQAVVDYDKIKE